MLPATHAVIKQAVVPPMKARIATSARSDPREGAIEVSAPSWIPIVPTLEKPERAYVAITSDLICDTNEK